MWHIKRHSIHTNWKFSTTSKWNGWIFLGIDFEKNIEKVSNSFQWFSNRKGITLEYGSKVDNQTIQFIFSNLAFLSIISIIFMQEVENDIKNKWDGSAFEDFDSFAPSYRTCESSDNENVQFGGYNQNRKCNKNREYSSIKPKILHGKNLHS